MAAKVRPRMKLPRSCRARRAALLKPVADSFSGMLGRTAPSLRKPEVAGREPGVLVIGGTKVTTKPRFLSERCGEEPDRASNAREESELRRAEQCEAQKHTHGSHVLWIA